MVSDSDFASYKDLLLSSTKQYRICWKLSDLTIILVLVIYNGMTPTTGQESLCGGSNRAVKRRNLSSQSLPISSTPFADGSDVNEEWIFYARDNTSFVTVEFLKFDLSGPLCTSSSQPGISKLRIKTSVDENWYCKGRRKPDNVTSQVWLQISYCRKFAGANVTFRVESSCNGKFLVKRSAARMHIPKSRKSTCYIQLISTAETMRIAAQFDDVRLKKANKDKCRAGHLIVTDAYDKSLLPKNAEKLCNYESHTEYSVGMSFNVTSDIGSDRIVIAHRGAEFFLSFHLVSRAQTKKDYSPSASTTTLDYTNTTSLNGTGGADVIQNSTAMISNASSKSYGHIIGIGCGGIFVLIIIILALIFIRKKKRKKRESRKLSHSKKYVPTNTAENDSPAADSTLSINNAMYGQIVDGRRHESIPMTGIYQEGTFDGGDGLDRRNTRPQLPPPATCNAEEDRIKTRASNIYERIEDMQSHRGLESRPMSCATFTSDEFSDDDVLDTNGCNYSVIANPSTLGTDRGNCDGRILSHDTPHYDKMTPQISVHPAMTLEKDDATNRYKSYVPSSLRENLHEEPSRSSLNVDVTDRYVTPRPSLPNLPLVALAEDAENYLSPRPSCPDIMGTAGYSSTDDLNEMRRRLLTAAHPSLLGTTNFSSASVPETTYYHSPKVANEVRPSVHYSTPRRNGNTCT